jgi:hypothetical protein
MKNKLQKKKVTESEYFSDADERLPEPPDDEGEEARIAERECEQRKPLFIPPLPRFSPAQEQVRRRSE